MPITVPNVRDLKRIEMGALRQLTWEQVELIYSTKGEGLVRENGNLDTF